MPFIARNSAGERVDITRVADPRSLRADSHTCPLCEQQMIVKAGLLVRAHFAHRAACSAAERWDVHPESEAHLSAKAFLRDWLHDIVRDYGAERVWIDLEVPIPMPWRPRGRVADVLVVFPCGWRVACEAQLAAITPQEIVERTEDYRMAGVDVFWYLGGRAASRRVRFWCARRMSVAFSLTQQPDAWGLSCLEWRSGSYWETEPANMIGDYLFGATAVVRFVQAWGMRDYESILRGLGVRRRGRAAQKIAGVLGYMNTEGWIERIQHGWKVKESKRIYPNIPRLSSGGIEAMRQTAHHVAGK